MPIRRFYAVLKDHQPRPGIMTYWWALCDEECYNQKGFEVVTECKTWQVASREAQRLQGQLERSMRPALP